ncbi:MAG: beta-ketoacyl synthase N-terminal-like domain-containing protein, partial [Anaerobiospirillum sp.]|nr:beta-ketoacyl synthase N-terminal-like domain-containing protein [Anaerobiospirillum sp.]
MKRVVITGMGAVTAFGESWESLKQGLLSYQNAVVYMNDWDCYQGLGTKLGAPVPNFKVPAYYPRKMTRSMGRVAQMATRACELALIDANLLHDQEVDPCVSDGSTGIAYGSCTGSTKPIRDFGSM